MKLAPLSWLVRVGTLSLCLMSAACIIITGEGEGEGEGPLPDPEEEPVVEGREPEVADPGSPCQVGDRGVVLAYEKVAEYATAVETQAQLDAFLGLYTDLGYVSHPVEAEVQYGVDSYRVSYCTVDAALPDPGTGERTRRKLAVATGMLSVPRRSEASAVVLYHHGTSVSYDDAPSNPSIEVSFDGPPSSTIFAGSGFIYVAPDYLGLGSSPLTPHRYFHAGSEADSATDLLKAAQEVLGDLEVARTEDLFLFGFSQGGHAALATQRRLEEELGVTVTATATSGGVFDVERFFLSCLANEEVATLALYASYVLVAYDTVYGVYGSTAEVFAPAYAGIVEGLFDMEHTFDEVVAALAPSARETLAPGFYAAVSGDAEHPVRVRMRENGVDEGWVPGAPVRNYHSPEDEEVAYGDAEASVAALNEGGGAVTIETLDGLDHINTWLQAMPRAVGWFRGLE